MTATKKVAKEFYQSLGRLFYAVAMADHSVHTKEMDRLKNVVREQWLDHDDFQDEHGTDAAFQIEYMFEWLLEYEKDAAECFEAFSKYYMDNEALFSERTKYLLLATARAIASAFAGSNKSELIMLGRLELLLKIPS
ncbi:MAG: hypothetical protein KJN65_07015 [Croceitalea sp.]|nr:hypothetical protein [Croceitalea sp.]